MQPLYDPAKVLEQSIQQERLGHAILLYGHCLKTLDAVSQKVASRLLGDVSNLGTHPDFFTLRPVNKMRQINVESTRKLISNIQHSPLRSDKKVAVIYEADRMHVSAANAFLKTLEEPPSNTTLVLMTTRPYEVLDTIRSRCLHFNFLSEPVLMQSEEWSGWLNDYRSWLEALCRQDSSKVERLKLIVNLYGLVARFSPLLESISDENWEALAAEKKGLSDEESIAEKAGFQKSIRNQLFRGISEVTRDFVLNERNLSRVRCLIKVSEYLERITGLLNVNLNESTALEAFLLESLRVWTSGG